MRVEQKLSELGLTLPEPPEAVGNYIGAVQVDNLLFISGHGPPRSSEDPDGGPSFVVSGVVGDDVTLEQAYETAKRVMLNCLATIKRELGDLDRVKRIVKLLGMVNCTEDFTDHPRVINGASDLLVSLYGEAGRHARSAVGMQQLPMSIAVEIEMIVEVTPDP